MNTLNGLSCQRAQFSLREGVHYLNCAYMGPLPQRVQQAGITGIARKADPSRITAADFFHESDRVRMLFARLIGSQANRIAIIPSVSYGIATVVRNTSMRRGQNIVLSAEQFPSNVHGWRKLAQKSQGHVRTIAPNAAGANRGAEWNERLWEAIDLNTAVVALPQVHWTDGTRFDLKAIGQRAREVGAALVVDATQSLGALPFNIDEIKPDAVICAGYKWLLGPYSIGAAYYGPRYEKGEPLEETWIARRGSADFRRLVEYEERYEPGAMRFDVGERSNFILLPMFATALEMILEWSPVRIQHYCRQLVAEPIAKAQALGFTVEQEKFRASHLFGLRAPPSLDLTTLQGELQKRRVFASLRGSALRVSPNIYNDAADLDALVDGLESAINAAGTVAVGS